MKKITICISLLFSTAYSQEYKEYYVVQKNGFTIEPITKEIKSNNDLKMTFAKQELQSFFNNKIITEFEKAFPESNNEILKNTYFIRIESSVSKNSLAQLTDVLFVEEVGKTEDLNEPNDYFFEIDKVKNHSILDLVRAPQAWEITKGNNPNVLLGIVEDSGFNIQHPELEGKIVQHFGTTTTNSSHATMVSSVAAGNSNNNLVLLL